jgi:glycosyltransferase involved in cell wall biosynthesis
MKIVYLINGIDNSGGQERVVSAKANYLADNLGHEVYIIATSGKEPFFKLSEKIKLIYLNLNYKILNSTNLINRILKIIITKRQHKKLLKRELFRIKADVVISTYSREATFLSSIKDGSRKILENHFSKGFKVTDAKYRRKSFLYKFLFSFQEWYQCKFTIPKYDAFVVLTEQDKLNWGKYVKNVCHIYNPISFTTEQNAILNTKIAISVGRLEPQKNYSCLIEIWNKIHKKLPDWKLNIFGSGSQENMLKEQIKKLNLFGVVNILPPEKNIILRYLESSIYLATSCYEGFPMTLMEAFECGLPIVSFDIISGPREIIQNEENGFLIEFDNKKEFAEKTIILMENQSLRNKFGKNAKQRAKKFYIEDIMQKWRMLLEEEKKNEKQK